MARLKHRIYFNSEGNSRGGLLGRFIFCLQRMSVGGKIHTHISTRKEKGFATAGGGGGGPPHSYRGVIPIETNFHFTEFSNFRSWQKMGMVS